MGVASVVSFTNVPTWTMVGGDAAAIATEIARSQLSYRIGVLCDVVGQLLSVFTILALYRLLKGVNEIHAAVMLALGLIGVPMSFANLLMGMAPLVLLSGADYLSAFDKSQLDALAVSFLSVRGYGVRASMVLWGLLLVPFGLLVFRSGFIPRFLGVILIVGCFGHSTVGVTSLLFPAYAGVVSPLQALSVGELLMIAWLLIKGVRTQPRAAESPT
jgi:hypothetical protein